MTALRDKIARIIANDPYPLQGHYDRADRVLVVLAEDASEESPGATAHGVSIPLLTPLDNADR
jgi:hypothetical protein